MQTDSLRLVIHARSLHLAGNIRRKARLEILISLYWGSQTYDTELNGSICARKPGLVSLPQKEAIT